MPSLLAWLVHFYTALGIPLAFAALFALRRGDVRLFFLLLALAVIIDCTDGPLARHLRVKEVLPHFDGHRLDDIVDYLTYVFIPCLALVDLQLLPLGSEWLAALPMLASGYGFAQQNAKTDQSFVGFPSYWNVVVFYIYTLRFPPALNTAIILFLSILVFVPIHYLYPSQTRWLKSVTIIGGVLWGFVLLFLLLSPHTPYSTALARLSLLYPIYYVVLSLAHHAKLRRATFA